MLVETGNIWIHFPFLPFGVNLTLVIPTSLLPLFHLSLEGPDHQEEVGGKQPAEDAADNVSDGEYVDLAAVAVAFAPFVVSLNRYLRVS